MDKRVNIKDVWEIRLSEHWSPVTFARSVHVTKAICTPSVDNKEDGFVRARCLFNSTAITIVTFGKHERGEKPVFVTFQEGDEATFWADSTVFLQGYYFDEQSTLLPPLPHNEELQQQRQQPESTPSKGEKASKPEQMLVEWKEKVLCPYMESESNTISMMADQLQSLRNENQQLLRREFEDLMKKLF